MAIGKEILSFEDVSKSYSGVSVLRDMNFKLHEGEIHCIVGENGAGKSTFIKLLSGAVHQDTGKLTVFGQSVSPNRKPRDMFALGIATIYQDIDLVDTLTVADNIFLGNEIKQLGVVNKKMQKKLARELLENLHISMDVMEMVESLSPAKKQTLQMVKALHRNARIVVMDEPTASLGNEESQALLEMVKMLAESGIGIIYISHYLEEIFAIADTITVLKDGDLVACHKASDVDSDRIISEMVGRQASQFYKRKRVPIKDTVLKVEDITLGSVVKNVSFEVRAGEVLGIGGLVGAGRTELMNAVFGVEKKKKGHVYLDGKKLRIERPRDAITSGICMLSEERKESGLFMDRSLLENVCIVKNEWQNFISPAKDREQTLEMVQKLNIKTRGASQTVGTLSGGNQQKSVIARWLLTDYRVIIFDEPTKGVDIGAKEEIYKLIVDLASMGKAIVMISSDMPELISMSDRIFVMRSGEHVGTVDADNIDEKSLMEMYLGFGM